MNVSESLKYLACMAVPDYKFVVLASGIEFGSAWIGRKSNPSNRLRERNKEVLSYQ